MNIAILILAAGSSSRMKTPKQLLRIGNNTLLGVTVEHALKSKAQKVFCVLGANSEKIKPSLTKYDIEIILNSNHKKGLSTSITKGIACTLPYSYNAVLIMLADQPNADSKYINALIDASVKHPKKIIASKYQETYGVPAIFPREFYGGLLQLKGDKGAKTLLNSNLDNITGIEANPILCDIDTQEDYLNYLKQR